MKTMMMLTTTAYMSERFNRENIMLLESMGYQVHVVANFDKGNPIDDTIISDFKEWIELHHGKWISIPLTRSPKDVSGFRTAKKLCLDLVHQYQYDFIHCHTPMGGVLGRVIAKKTGTKVIYTAHGLHFYTGASLLHWLIYYPVEKHYSRCTDMLITINQEDYKRSVSKLKARRTEYIPGIGIDTKKYVWNQPHDEVRKSLCDELGIPCETSTQLLLSVGEINSNKNQEAIVRAIALSPRLEHLHYLVCGIGRGEEHLRSVIAELGLTERVHMLGYRTDVVRLCQGVDTFVFPSYREGLSVALMEAVACGIPVIASNARGNAELVKSGANGFICTSNTPEEYVKRFDQILSLEKDSVKTASEEIIKAFDLSAVNEKMRCFYMDFSS